MKVAIIGAGLSGLSCAFELKKHGIIPTIFEKQAMLNVSAGFPVVVLNLLDKKFNNPVEYLSKNNNLHIKPLFPLNKIEFFSPNHQSTVKAHHGYIFLNNEKDVQSIKSQICSQVNIPINFNTVVDINTIKNKFDYVIVATGESYIPYNLGVWKTNVRSVVKVSTLLGNFKEMTIKIWFNNDFAKNSFVYLVPESSKKAKLVNVVNDINMQEIEYYWNKFLENQNLNHEIIESRTSLHNAGYVTSLQIDNIFLVGNCAGMTDCFIGTGCFRAIQSGIYAAQSIVKGLNYSELMKSFINELKIYREFRKAMNTFDNKDFDKFILSLKVPLVKQSFYNNPFFKLADMKNIIKNYNKFNLKDDNNT